MAIAVVQSTSVVNTTGTTTAITVTSTGAGHLLALTFVGEGATQIQSIVSVTDNQSNSWALVPSSRLNFNGTFFDSEIWYANVATAGVTTVTVTIKDSIASGDCIIGFIEISGAATSGVIETAQVAQNAGSPPLGPALTTASAGSILLATCFPTSTGASGVNSPWTAFFSSLKFNTYFLPGAAGTYHAVWIPNTGQIWGSSGVSFLPAGGGPSGAQKASTFLVL